MQCRIIVSIFKGTRHKGAQKRIKNSLIMYKLDLKELIEDINLSIEAIQNKDYKDI